MGSIGAIIAKARLKNEPIAAFPGPLPESSVAAYAIQDEAIATLSRSICGWKVAMIAPPLRAQFESDRLAGPVFAGTLYENTRDEIGVSMIPGGFMAVEAEFVIRLGSPLLAKNAPFSHDAVRAAIDTLHVGAEIAGCPLASVNDLGPGATIACFGNNRAIVMGEALPLSALHAPETWPSRTLVNGDEVGAGSMANVPGGPIAAVLFLANHLARRGLNLEAGHIISTGQTTGVHLVKIGDRIDLEFDANQRIKLVVTAATDGDIT